jgi:hypothetical protein
MCGAANVMAPESFLYMAYEPDFTTRTKAHPNGESGSRLPFDDELVVEVLHAWPVAKVQNA